MARPLIFLFPGQSSRDKEMFARLALLSQDAADNALAQVQQRLNREMRFEFANNQEIQLAVLAMSQAYLALLKDSGLTPVASAGLSLGEYSHLVDIGALDVDTAFDLVAARGVAYDQGPEGVMVALQPLAAEDADALVAELRESHGWTEKELALANDNSPTQCVVAGSASAVEAFVAVAEERHYAVATVIEQNIPMHTPRFKPVVVPFSKALERTPWKTAKRSYWPNVSANSVQNADGATINEYLRRHVVERVLWRQTIDALNGHYPDAVFVEVGPRNVLRNMLTRRWIDKDRVVSVDDGATSLNDWVTCLRKQCERI